MSLRRKHFQGEGVARAKVLRWEPLVLKEEPGGLRREVSGKES